MKFLLVLAVVVGMFWWLSGRSARERAVRREATQPAKARAKGPQTLEMVACAHCGVHLPRDDALTDGALAYCGAAHRLAGPRSL
jgi:uncharacterized protein